MAEVDAAKKARTKAKTAVTTAMKRVKGACSRKADSDVITQLGAALESAYEDCLAAQDDYQDAVVLETGQVPPDLAEYQVPVKDTYDEGREAIKTFRKEQSQLAAKPLRDRLKLSITRLRATLARGDDAVKDSNDESLLQCLKDEIEPQVNDMLDCLCKLSEVMEDSDLAGAVDHHVRDADKCKFELYMKQLSLARPHSLFDALEDLPIMDLTTVMTPGGNEGSKGLSENNTGSGGPSNDRGIITHTTVTPTTSAIVCSTGNSSSDQALVSNANHTAGTAGRGFTTPVVSQATYSSLAPVSSVRAGDSNTFMMSPAQSQVSHSLHTPGWFNPHLAATPVSSVAAGQSGTLIGSAQSQVSQPYHTPGWVDFPLSSTLPNGMTNPAVVAGSPHIHGTAANSVTWADRSMQQPLIDYRSLYTPMSTGVQMSVANQNSSMLGGPHIQGTAANSVTWADRSMQQPLTDYRSLYTPMSTGVQTSVANQNSSMHSGHWNPTLHNSTGTSSISSQHHIKRTELPDFDGDRKKWPEFKAVFRHLAESTYSSEQTLAYELKRHVKAPADVLIQTVYSTRPGAYQKMWKKLGDVYDDPGACVSSALATLHSIEKPSDDFRSLVTFINEVDAVHAQLEELGQLSCVSVRDVDRVNNLLPMSIKMEWSRKYRQLPAHEKLQPFATFMNFLDDERAAMARVADTLPIPPKKPSLSTNKRNALVGRGEEAKGLTCALHGSGSSSHVTEDCPEFLKLSVSGKYDALKRAYLCFKCFGRHVNWRYCTNGNCEHCGKSHNKMLCAEKTEVTKQANNFAEAHAEEVPETLHSAAHTATAQLSAVCPIMQVPVAGTRQTCCVFMDGGSDSSYVTFKCVDRLKLKPVRKIELEVTTMGNAVTTVPSAVYEVPLRTTEGKCVTVEAFGMKEITGPVTSLNLQVVSNLFPDIDAMSLQRQATTVDILLGSDYFGLHPKLELARSGENLSVMKGRLGICLQGAHESLIERTEKSVSCARFVHGSTVRSNTFICDIRSHPGFERPSAEVTACVDRISTQEKPPDIDSFVPGKELGTSIQTKCGASVVQCGKCPLVGHTYSFLEQQELDMIQRNLEYDAGEKHYVTSYPWLVSPTVLPDNYRSPLATLQSTERTPMKYPAWAEAYGHQITHMIERGVAVKLRREDIADWSGPAFYLSHLAVVNPKSASTPIRLVFNSSQVFQGISLNSCLAKGPDSYTNSSLGILLRWREESCAVVGDIRKMFHSIHLKETEQHCHRFLWRDLESREPDVYIITRVNMGDRPASAIATEALKATAELKRDEFPRVADFVSRNSYIDDLIDSVKGTNSALKLAEDTEKVLDNGGFSVKCWQITGQNQPMEGTTAKPTIKMLKGGENETAVLGVTWKPVDDVISFHVKLNFSQKRRGNHVGPDLTVESMPTSVPLDLTRRIVLQQVMAIYDPLGLLSPFTLQAKKLLRKTWELKLGWDDPLPAWMHELWSKFFTKLFQVEQLEYGRCLTPEDAVGPPWLILMSDGSDTAYGFVAYVRWKLQDGSYFVQLVMAKSRIAPLHKVTTPRMELNGAVLSKRGRQVIEQEMRFQFERVLHLVDSETVMNMIHKTSTRFQVYEGSRIGEIQAAAEGHMEDWAWIPGEQNTADMLTRGKDPSQLGPNSEWNRGPHMLYSPFDQWPIKFGKQSDERSPGEKTCLAVNVSIAKKPIIDLSRFSSIQTARLVIARILGMFHRKSISGGRTKHITPELLSRSEHVLLKMAQGEFSQDENHARFKALNPRMNSDGLLAVGARMSIFNPMSGDSTPQVLLPTKHQVTKLLMREAHERGHLGRDGTLAKFRERYWTPHGDKVANAAKRGCQMCKLRDARLLQQAMGQLPEARLKPGPPFNSCMLDLLGPFPVRGEVQKRTTGKCYFILMTDLASRAVHIECTFGYDTTSFLIAFSRFVNVRGWPANIYSDPGSQLVGAERELQEAWSQIDRDTLVKEGAQSGTQWHFGPADSPWYQGAVESLVKTAKKCLKFSVHGQRLSAGEYLALCYEVANLMNERPIGLRTSPDSEVNILTPNSLLLGRATSRNPGRWLPGVESVKTRLQLVLSVAESFWTQWNSLYAPTLLRQNKWYDSHRDVQEGDIVLVADRNALRGEYRVARVVRAQPGRAGKVRQVHVTYKTSNQVSLSASTKACQTLLCQEPCRDWRYWYLCSKVATD